MENFLKKILDFKNLWSTIYIVPGSWRSTSNKGQFSRNIFLLFRWQLH